jgi:hypothetical protein
MPVAVDRETDRRTERRMIDYTLDTAHSILHVRPQSALSADDFVKLASAVDLHIEATGGLAGLIIETPSFPGWDSLGAMVAHFPLCARSPSAHQEGWRGYRFPAGRRSRAPRIALRVGRDQALCGGRDRRRQTMDDDQFVIARAGFAGDFARCTRQRRPDRRS